MPTNAQSLTPSRPVPQSSRAQQLDAYGAPVTHRGWTNPIELLMKWIADDPVKNAKTVAEIVVGPYGAYEDAGRARKSFSKGNYGEAAFDATMMGLGVLPLGGAVVKGIKAARGPVYRSRLASALEDMPMDKMSGQQAVSHFKKYPGGVGADELDYTGVGAMTQQPNVTRQQLIDQYNANPLDVQDTTLGYPSNQPTKYADYTLPGGEDYQEMLLTLPRASKQGGAWVGINPQTGVRVQANTFGEMNDMKRQGWKIEEDRAADIPAYTGGHYDEPNVLAHGRYNTRNIDGDKTLFVEEIQSDWHQAGRKRGYVEAAPEAVRVKAQGELDEVMAQLDIHRKQVTQNRAWSERFNSGEITAAERNAGVPYSGVGDAMDALNDKRRELEGILNPNPYDRVPDAPYKATDKWQGLAFQRMVRHAAENGHDRIAWTPGKVQADRYDLSKQIDHIELSTTSGGVGRAPDGEFKSGMLEAYDHSGSKVIDKHIRSPEELADHIGKEAAEKILSAKGVHGRSAGLGRFTRKIEGVDLKIGGEGMKEFYDKILVKNANKFGKKYGQKVEVKNLWGPTAKPKEYGIRQGDEGSVLENSWFASSGAGDTKRFNTKADAEAWVEDQLKINAEKAAGGTEVWSLKITDKMKKDILKGGVALSGTGVAASSLLAGQEDYY